MICYDYRTLDFDTSPLTGYTVIDVVAWSMGVWAASQVLSKVSLPIRRRIAINGTPFPIDEKRGIPPAIFMGTLEGLNEASLRKFQRRMCADGNVLPAFSLQPRTKHRRTERRTCCRRRTIPNTPYRDIRMGTGYYR